MISELMALLFIDSSMIKRRDIVNNKRDKRNKRQRSVVKLSSKENKLGEPSIISLQDSRNQKDMSI